MLSHSIALAFGGVAAAIAFIYAVVFAFCVVANFWEARAVRRGTPTRPDASMLYPSI